MFHKEGYKIIFIAIVSFIAALLLADKFISIAWLRIAIQLVFVF
ncbi:MAG: phosphatidylserine decarboxylase family protein, partial [Flavobacterium sp.]|nr:phosphatidylserine decarboxylase family protein [Flavobacterium sp.]